MKRTGCKEIESVESLLPDEKFPVINFIIIVVNKTWM